MDRYLGYIDYVQIRNKIIKLMDYEKNFLNFLDLKIEIDNNFFNKTKFSNLSLELKFQKSLEKFTYKNQITLNLLLIAGYIASYIYILLSYTRPAYLLFCTGIFTIALIVMIFSHFNENKKILVYLNHCQIFLSFINLSIKAFLSCIYYKSEETFSEAEVIRIIIYQLLSTCIFMYKVFEADFISTMVYFIMSFITILVAYFYNNKNFTYILDGIISLAVYVILYIIRKQMDYNMRVIFSKKIKFQAFYLYIKDYLNGLNGYTLNIKNSKNLLINKKIEQLLLELNLPIISCQQTNRNIEDPLNKKKKENLYIENYDKTSHPIVIFLKNLRLKEKYNEANNVFPLYKENKGGK